MEYRPEPVNSARTGHSPETAIASPLLISHVCRSASRTGPVILASVSPSAAMNARTNRNGPVIPTFVGPGAFACLLGH